MRAYIHRSGSPPDIGPMVAVKDRRNALKNPYAHLKLADITVESVKESPMMWDPVHYLESCPSSDGACAVVMTSREGGEAAARAGRAPAWVLASAVRSEPAQFPGRDPVAPKGASDCATDVYRQAGITRPREQIDCAELYVPFSWYEPMWLEAHHLTEPGDGWKMVENGTTALRGSFPVNMSGGVLSSNPIGASGLLRFAEAAMQVRGTAGEHQIDRARVALAQAYGASAQYFSMWVVASSLDPIG
jgi:acetyl-CoA C-acetyltransferase